MKTINTLTLAVTMAVFSSCGIMHGTKADQSMRTVENIIELPNTSKNEIYVKANSWLAGTFESDESAIEFQDKEAGKIVGIYAFPVSVGIYTHIVRNTINIDVKDNKLRITYSNPLFKTINIGGETDLPAKYRALVTEKGVNQARTEWAVLTDSLKKYLDTPSSDW